MNMLIEIDALKLSIEGSPILEDVHMRLREGGIYGLLGPNGAGKSTTLSVLTGLRAADSGSVRVLGMDPAQSGTALRAKIGVLAEDSGFYGWMSAQDYLRWMAQLYARDLSPQDIAERLHQVGLAVSNQQRVATFSRGMKQRLGLARALLNDPQLLLLDEPTNGLDPRGRREIHDLLIALAVGRGVGILLCTHLLDDVDRLCDRVGILCDGKTLLEDDLAELLAEKSGSTRYVIRLATQAPPVSRSLPEGTNLVARGDGSVHLEVSQGVPADCVWRALFAAGWAITGIEKKCAGLEDLYLQVTKAQVVA